MTLFAFNPLAPLLSSVQASQVSLEALTPVVCQLRETLEAGGTFRMTEGERDRVESALQRLDQVATHFGAASGLVCSEVLQPFVQKVVNAWPARMGYRSEAPDDITREYCLSAEIASGGCSKLFHGYHLENGTLVAIKVADVEENPSISQDVADQLLRREYEILEALRSSSRPGIHRFGTMNGKACMVMEHLHGRDLHELQDDLLHGLKTSDDLDQLVEIGRQAVSEVAAVHEQGIVHCDVKPDNFMVHNRRLRIFDFGIARREGEVQSFIGGTPGYMSPESFTQNPTGFPRDVFALGAMLYQLMTGRPPYEGASVEETQQNLMNPEFHPELPSAVLLRNRPDLKKGLSLQQLQRLNHRLRVLDSIVMRAINRDPNLRFQDAGHMLADFRRFDLTSWAAMTMGLGSRRRSAG
ncbi:MAG TPA: serine/threonine-protein kinase [bacterium]|nr:serine/threonine-protein kinase [bacterium]